MLKKLPVKKCLSVAILVAVLLATLSVAQPVSAAQTCTQRYYLSPVIGTGSEEDSLRPLLNDLMKPNGDKPFETWAAIYGPIDSTGQLLIRWSFVTVFSFNHNFLLHQDELGALPDLPLTTPLADFSRHQLSMLEEVLLQFDLDTSILTTATTYEDVIYFIGQTLAGSNFTIPVPYSPNCPGL